MALRAELVGQDPAINQARQLGFRVKPADAPGPLAKQHQPLLARCGPCWRKACSLQSLTHALAGLWIIIHDQHALAVHSICCLIRSRRHC